MKVRAVNPSNPNSDATHPNIQEILRKRREMLNRVKADLERVAKLQEEFRESSKRPILPIQEDK